MRNDEVVRKEEEKKGLINAVKEILGNTKTIKAQTTEIGKMLIKYHNISKGGNSGISFKGPLPWQVTSKEVYMLVKQGYTIEELKIITRYSEDDINKKYNQHVKNNM